MTRRRICPAPQADSTGSTPYDAGAKQLPADEDTNGCLRAMTTSGASEACAEPTLCPFPRTLLGCQVAPLKATGADGAVCVAKWHSLGAMLSSVAAAVQGLVSYSPSHLQPAGGESRGLRQLSYRQGGVRQLSYRQCRLHAVHARHVQMKCMHWQVQTVARLY